MTCGEAHDLLAEVAGGELDGARAEAVRAHADGCGRCGTALEELERTIGLCRRAGTEALPDGYALSLRQALVEAGPPRRRWPNGLIDGLIDGLRAILATRPKSLTAALALTAVMVIAGTRLVGRRAPLRTAATVAYRVPASKVALVKVDFVAEEAIDGVAFEITLPDGLRFVSGGRELAERTFRFEGKLVAGSNPVPIAVKGPRPGRYSLIAHAIGPSLDVTQQVTLEVTI
jgi:hypothetical protein